MWSEYAWVRELLYILLNEYFYKSAKTNKILFEIEEFRDSHDPLYYQGTSQLSTDLLEIPVNINLS